jgi:oxygen-independent coproporphyrinogen-3 oxidase
MTSKRRSPVLETRWSALQALESFGIRRTREGYYYIAHYYPLKAMRPLGRGEPKRLLGVLDGTEVETYVHFPFCEIRCSFCHFYKEISKESSAPNLEHPILDAVLTEISRTVDVIGKIKARSFYVGGGTPSLITLRGLDRLLACVDKNFEILPNAEVKFELFPKRDIPDRLDALLAALSSFGVTDIVVDLESGNQASLNYVGRSISSMDGYLDVIARCVAKGFKSIVTGLIIGLPYETEATLLQTLETLAAIPEITVINTFPLITRYPDPIWRQLKSRPDLFHSSQSRDQLWLFARDFLKAKGFVEGPISYLRRPGKVPRQQFDKFECVDLIAFGPSAFGYINGERWSAQYFNLCNANDYIKAVNAGGLPMWRAGGYGQHRALPKAAYLCSRQLSTGVPR